MAKIDRDLLERGDYEGQILWACARGIVRPPKNNKGHLKPTRFICIKNKYNSYPIVDKKGNTNNKRILLIGYNYEIFDNELDCIEEYSNINKEIITLYEDYLVRETNKINLKIEQFKKFIR